jgi:hypothetical protein
LFLGKQKEELLQYVGHISQVAGATPFEFKGGRSEGVKAIEVKTGSGFRFTIIPDRGMDIANAEFCGKPITWMCRNGIVAPQYFENGGYGFHRTFMGGLVTTCGLTQVGAPGVDGDEVLGVHGRISHLPAESVNIYEAWQDEEFVMKISGTLRETSIYAENLVLQRTIITKMGESRLWINDVVSNEGYAESPFMILYHVNFGFPVVSENSKLYCSSMKVRPWINQNGQAAIGTFDKFESPTPNYLYNLFLHELSVEQECAQFGIINESINFGAYVAINPSQLPLVTEWKMIGQQDYVVAIEPGNCIPEGRLEARKNNRLHILKPGERYEIEYEIGVLEGIEAIDSFISNCR